MASKIWNVSVYDENKKFIRTFYFTSMKEAQEFVDDYLWFNYTHFVRVGFEKV